MVNVILEIFHQIWIRVVCQDDLFGTKKGADEAGEAGASSELQNVFREDEGRI